MSFAQWTGAIVFFITVGGYVYNGEKEHDKTVVERDRSIHQRDSIIEQMGDHYKEFIEFKKTYYDNLRATREKDAQLDIRMDNMETRETKSEIRDETRFEDFINWYKPKIK